MRAAKHIYVVRVQLLEVKPVVERVLLVPSNIVLPKLHAVLQIVMGWTNTHTCEFRVNDDQYSCVASEIEEGAERKVRDGRSKKLQQLLKKPFDRLEYHYDFGDCWVHSVVLEDRFTYDPEVVLPVCVGGQMACPPEDVGGVAGYRRFLAALADEDDPEQEAYLEWIGGVWEAEFYDLHSTNVLLGRLFPEGL